MTQSTSPTRTLAARPPDGFPMSQPRYRSYVLFGATGFVLAIVNLVLLCGLRALASGIPAWQNYLASLGSGVGLVLTAFLLLGTCFFAIRWLRVGAKIPAVRIGSLPAPSVPLVMVGHFAGFVAVTLGLVIALSGLLV